MMKFFLSAVQIVICKNKNIFVKFMIENKNEILRFLYVQILLHEFEIKLNFAKF